MRTVWEETKLVESNWYISDFAARINDPNPPHHYKEAAVKAGFEDIIAHWTIAGGYISSMLARNIPGVIARRVDMRFPRPMYAGMVVTITCTIMSRKKNVARATVTIKDKLGVLVMAFCTLVLPEGV